MDAIHEFLLIKGVEAVAVHGSKDQEERTWAIDEFKKGNKDVLIATDVASKGLDFEGIQARRVARVAGSAGGDMISRNGRGACRCLRVAFCAPIAPLHGCLFKHPSPSCSMSSIMTCPRRLRTTCIASGARVRCCRGSGV